MQEKDIILEALETGDYQLRFEPISGVSECTRYDGTKFYLMEDTQDAKGCTDMGNCNILVEGEECSHEFIYDMGCGDWSGDEYCDDEDVIEALESLDEFIPYDEYDGDKQWVVYAHANNIPVNSPYYWSDEEDAPKDIESLGDDEVELPVQYFISLPHGACSEFMDMECNISDADLYNLYKLVAEEIPNQDDEDDEDTEPIELADSDIENVYPALYEDIKEQVEEQAQDVGYQDEEGLLQFKVLLTRDLFEENL